MVDRDAALGHHRFEVAVADRIPAVPAHGPEHDLPPEVTSLEVAHASTPRWRSRRHVTKQPDFATEPYDIPHLVERVGLPVVVPARELRHIAIHVLRADLVECPRMGSLEHRPERLDALRSRVAPHILALRVVDALVIVEDQPEPGRVLVGVDLGVGDDPVLDEALERPAGLCCKVRLFGDVSARSPARG